uniref:transposase n=1 Tax=Nonomuraea jabiensis TaxID=882448 RepID=UPI001FE5856C|nr:transposase [Nonomuraea jabiensis]
MPRPNGWRPRSSGACPNARCCPSSRAPPTGSPGIAASARLPGSGPKIKDKLGRYSPAVFTGSINIGPYEAAKHIAGVTARELYMVRNRHITLKKLNATIADVVNASPSWTSSGPRWSW